MTYSQEELRKLSKRILWERLKGDQEGTEDVSVCLDHGLSGA